MKNKRGFTLVEVIIAIVVIGIFMYAGMEVLINSGKSSVTTDSIVVAQSLAEEKMEEIMSKPYALVSSEASTPFTGGFSSYASSVNVDWVSDSDLDASTGSNTGYKRIRVSVSTPLLSAPVMLESIRTDY